MDSGEIPIPIGGEVAVAEPKPVIARWRWWMHLCVLGIFPLIAGVSGFLGRNNDARTLLPKSVPGLLLVSVYELLTFFVLFGIAWLASRVSGKQLLLKWRGGARPFLLGFAYSVGLRVVIMVILFALMISFWLAFGFPAKEAGEGGLRPQIEHMVDAKALTENPLYLVLVLTLLSFVVAGFREEFWRAAMLAGIGALFPRLFESWRGRIMAVAMVAVLFGLGHTAQGPAGVALTGFLGLGLGIVMLWHRSIWEAVIAHGFFDASTFVFVYLLVKYGPQNL
ncbi:MAG: hypothetical protein JWR26_2548 [Pedosphaera sp.]|nr:hypothetical protein [Pedosphaera sp.]